MNRFKELLTVNVLGVFLHLRNFILTGSRLMFYDYILNCKCSCLYAYYKLYTFEIKHNKKTTQNCQCTCGIFVK